MNENGTQEQPSPLRVEDVSIGNNNLGLSTDPEATEIIITLTGVNVKRSITGNAELKGGVPVEKGLVRYELSIPGMLPPRTELHHGEKFAVQFKLLTNDVMKIKTGNNAGEYEYTDPTKLALALVDSDTIAEAEIVEAKKVEAKVETPAPKLNLRLEDFMLRWDRNPDAKIELCISIGPKDGSEEPASLPGFPKPVSGTSFDTRELPLKEMLDDLELVAAVTLLDGDKPVDEDVLDITPVIAQAKEAAAKAVAESKKITLQVLLDDQGNVSWEKNENVTELIVGISKRPANGTPTWVPPYVGIPWPASEPFPLATQTEIIPDTDTNYVFEMMNQQDRAKIGETDVTDALKRIHADRLIMAAQEREAEAQRLIKEAEAQKAEAEKKLKDVETAAKKLEVQTTEEKPMDSEEKAAAKQLLDKKAKEDAKKGPKVPEAKILDLAQHFNQGAPHKPGQKPTEKAEGSPEASQPTLSAEELHMSGIAVPERIDGTVLTWEGPADALFYKLSVFVCDRNYFGRENVTYLLPQTRIDGTSFDLNKLDFTGIPHHQKAIAHIFAYDSAGNRIADRYKVVSFMIRLQRDARAKAEADARAVADAKVRADEEKKKAEEAKIQSTQPKPTTEPRREKPAQPKTEPAQVSPEMAAMLATMKEQNDNMQRMYANLNTRLEREEKARADAQAKREASEKAKIEAQERKRAEKQAEDDRKKIEDIRQREIKEAVEKEKREKAEAQAKEDEANAKKKKEENDKNGQNGNNKPAKPERWHETYVGLVTVCAAVIIVVALIILPKYLWPEQRKVAGGPQAFQQPPPVIINPPAPESAAAPTPREEAQPKPQPVVYRTSVPSAAPQPQPAVEHRQLNWPDDYKPDHNPIELFKGEQVPRCPQKVDITLPPGTVDVYASEEWVMTDYHFSCQQDEILRARNFGSWTHPNLVNWTESDTSGNGRKFVGYRFHNARQTTITATFTFVPLEQFPKDKLIL